MIINLHKQPTGNTCGPACIKMAHSSINGLANSESITIDDIAEMCGTDWVVGTPPDRMIKGLNELGMLFASHINAEKPFEKLKSVVDVHNICMLRTLTQGVPHWIVIESYIDNIYNVLDPWLGRIQYTEEELDKIWSVRDYYFFEVINIV